LHRVRLRGACLQEDGLEVVAEASSAQQAAELAASAKPNLILGDERMLGDPAFDYYVRFKMGKPAPMIVLLVPHGQTDAGSAVPQVGNVPIASTFSMDVPVHAMKTRLLELAARTGRSQGAPPVGAPVPGMGSRFTIAGGAKATTSWSSTESGEQASQPPGVTPGPASTVPEAPERRQGSRARQVVEQRMAALQASADGLRDPITGLPDARVLQKVLDFLTMVGYPAAVVAVQLRCSVTDDPGVAERQALTAELDTALLRSASAALRANVRQQDAVCRLDGTSFAIVLPGVEEHTAAEPLERLRAALFRVRRKYSDSASVVYAASGVGFWTPPMTPLQPLQAAWECMLAERQAREADAEETK
jgi:GGDEF domain-containing protein